MRASQSSLFSNGNSSGAEVGSITRLSPHPDWRLSVGNLGQSSSLCLNDGEHDIYDDDVVWRICGRRICGTTNGPRRKIPQGEQSKTVLPDRIKQKFVQSALPSGLCT